MNKHDNLKKCLVIFASFILVALLINLNNCKSGPDIPNLSSEKGEANYNLLVITLDTTRADRIGCYGCSEAETPNIDSLVENGVMFENTYCSVPLTLPSHSSIFTGREPIAHNIRNNGAYFLNEEETTMAEVFQQKGFTTNAIIAAFVLLSKFGLNQGFHYYEDSLSYSKAVNYTQTQIRADKVYAKFKNWLDKHYEERFFSWVHFYDPHRPYDAPGEWGERFAKRPYNGEIAYMDHYIGKILKDLDEKNIRDNTLIVVVGDHGEAFSEHEEIGHGIFCYEESLRIPLIFHNPTIWKERKVVTRRFSLIHLMPTILNLYRFPIPEAVQGTSMAHLLGDDDGNDEKDRPQYFESMFSKEDMNWAPLTGIIVKQHKYISLPKPELYDLENDPGETENLFKKENRLAKQLDKELQQYILKYAEKGKSSKRQLTGTDTQKLKSLGYISSFSQGDGSVIDPKEGIKLVNKLMLANMQITNNKLDEAETVLKEVIRDNPGDKTPPQAYEYLYNIAKKRGDMAEAEKQLKEGIDFFPETLWLKLKLATFYADAGRIDEAIKISHELLKLNDKYNQANILLARINREKGKMTEALKYYKRAMEIEPMNAKLEVDYAELLFENDQKEKARDIATRLSQNALLMNDPENTGLKTRIGLILVKMGEFEKTIKMTSKATSKGQESPPLLNQLGMAHFKKGNIPEALKAYNKALEIDGNNVLTLNNLGTLYLTVTRVKKDKNALAKAIEYLERAEKVDPKNASTLNSLAVASSFTGNRQKAIGYWERAIANAPNYLDVYFNLGITFIETGQKDKALKYLNMCKNRFYSRLNPRQQQQLDQLISEASRR